jgi:hypothetical protein
MLTTNSILTSSDFTVDQSVRFLCVDIVPKNMQKMQTFTNYTAQKNILFSIMFHMSPRKFKPVFPDVSGAHQTNSGTNQTSA